MFTAENLNKVAEFAKRNPFIAEYSLQQVTNVLIKNKLLDQGKATVDSFADIVRWSINKYKNRNNPWNGEPMLAGYINSSINMGVDAAKEVDVTSVNFEYALDENGSFRRGYSGEDIDAKPDQTRHLDNVVFAWMGSRGFILVDNILYEANPENGQRTDQVVSPEKFDHEISDANYGLARFLNDIGSNTALKLTNRGLEAVVVERAPEEEVLTAAETDYLAARLAEQIDLRQRVAAEAAAKAAAKKEVAPQAPEGPTGPSGG